MESSQWSVLKDEAVLDLTEAASKTVSQWFHDALSGNVLFWSCCQNTYMQYWGGVETVYYEMILPNHNTCWFLRSLKGPAL